MTELIMMKLLVALVLILATTSFIPLLLLVFTNWGKQRVAGCIRVGTFLCHASLVVALVGLILIIIVSLIVRYV